MKYDIEPAKTILRNFLKEIEEVKAIRKQMSPPQIARSFTIKDKMPEFDATELNSSEDTFWKERMLIFRFMEMPENIGLLCTVRLHTGF